MGGGGNNRRPAAPPPIDDDDDENMDNSQTLNSINTYLRNQSGRNPRG
jgi:hypothetical protein